MNSAFDTNVVDTAYAKCDIQINVSDNNVKLSSGKYVGTVRVMKNEWLDELNTVEVRKNCEKSEIEDCKWVEKINVGKELTRSETNQVHNLLQKYKSVFQLNDNDYGETNVTEHFIDTGNAKPLKQRQYRLP